MISKTDLNAHLAEFGVQYATENLRMEKVNVGFRDLSYFKKIEHLAEYVPMINCIIFNLDWLENADPEDILKVSFIQTRSAYHRNAIKNPSKYKLDSKTIKAWSEDLRSPLTHIDEAFYDLRTTKDTLKFTDDLINQLNYELENDKKNQLK